MALVASKKYLADMDAAVLSQRGFQVGDEVICDESRISYNKNCRNILYNRQGGTPLFARGGTFIIEPYTILQITGLSVEPGNEVFATLETADHVALDLSYNAEYLAHADKWVCQQEEIAKHTSIKSKDTCTKIANLLLFVNILALEIFVVLQGYSLYLILSGKPGWTPFFIAGCSVGVAALIFKLLEKLLDRREKTMPSREDIERAGELLHQFSVANGNPNDYNFKYQDK